MKKTSCSGTPREKTNFDKIHLHFFHPTNLFCIRYADRAVYVGNWVKGKRDGQGKCTAADGITYEGGWKNDLRDGHGTLRSPEGSSYVGDWKNDKYDGQGELTTLKKMKT